MLAAEHYSRSLIDVPLPNHLLEIHRSRISIHRANAQYSYPVIRLPHYLTRSLEGQLTRIYQTVHERALAFLVVVSGKPARKTANAISESESESKILCLDMAEVAGSNPAEPIVLWGALTK